MSGHSKWANIKFRKGIVDKKKGKVFTKLAHQITTAVREDSEIKLKLAIEKAKGANLPSENIDRAIKRGKGELNGVKLEEVTYEAMGPEKIAIIIKATTDNKNRTASEIRQILERNFAKLSGTGSVSWMFEQKGVLRVEVGGRSKEEIELAAIDAGANDIEEEGKEILIYSEPENLENLRKKLAEQNFSITNYEISLVPKNQVKIENPKAAKKILKLMDDLDNIEEVTSISANFNIPEDIMEKEEE